MPKLKNLSKAEHAYLKTVYEKQGAKAFQRDAKLLISASEASGRPRKGPKFLKTKSPEGLERLADKAYDRAEDRFIEKWAMKEKKPVSMKETMKRYEVGSPGDLVDAAEFETKKKPDYTAAKKLDREVTAADKAVEAKSKAKAGQARQAATIKRRKTGAAKTIIASGDTQVKFKAKPYKAVTASSFKKGAKGLDPEEIFRRIEAGGRFANKAEYDALNLDKKTTGWAQSKIMPEMERFKKANKGYSTSGRLAKEAAKAKAVKAKAARLGIGKALAKKAGKVALKFAGPVGVAMSIADVEAMGTPKFTKEYEKEKKAYNLAKALKNKKKK